MDGIFDELFDMNMDGEVDTLEQATGLAIFDEIVNENCGQEEVEEDDNSIEREELENAGLDMVELKLMDEDERREAIEDAGLDPDDFEFLG